MDTGLRIDLNLSFKWNGYWSWCLPSMRYGKCLGLGPLRIWLRWYQERVS